ncbi:DUF998 domain-containing protein [Devosia nitrariae]|nr:DUF998 domain-containing protein [Devosia nitrariae]
MTAGKTSLTRNLLMAGVVAGPLYVALGLFQMAIRPTFDITRHPLSIMSNGDLGWIQVMNFTVTGILTILGAIGIRRLIHPGRAGTSGPILLGLYGFGLVAAAIFPADPMLGFPPGTPADAMEISTTGILHFVAGAVGFLSFIAGCFVFARRFFNQDERGWGIYSVATGVIFLGAFAGIASGGGNPLFNVAFAIAVVVAWAWISALCLKFRREVHPDR